MHGHLCTRDVPQERQDLLLQVRQVFLGCDGRHIVLQRDGQAACRAQQASISTAHQAWWTWNRMQLGHKGPQRGAIAAHAPQFPCTSFRSSGGRVDAYQAARSKEVQSQRAQKTLCSGRTSKMAGWMRKMPERTGRCYNAKHVIQNQYTTHLEDGGVDAEDVGARLHHHAAGHQDLTVLHNDERRSAR